MMIAGKNPLINPKIKTIVGKIMRCEGLISSGKFICKLKNEPNNGKKKFERKMANRIEIKVTAIDSRRNDLISSILEAPIVFLTPTSFMRFLYCAMVKFI